MYKWDNERARERVCASEHDKPEEPLDVYARLVLLPIAVQQCAQPVQPHRQLSAREMREWLSCDTKRERQGQRYRHRDRDR